MASKERQLLEEISDGKTTWAPADTSEENRERFDQVEAVKLTAILDRLIADDFVGGYITHKESYSGKRRIDRVLVNKGLTFKGQDKSQWPA
jgi:hypothetical protein